MTLYIITGERMRTFELGFCYFIMAGIGTEVIRYALTDSSIERWFAAVMILIASLLLAHVKNNMES